MAITIQLPAHVELQLRDRNPNLDDSAREQFLITQYNAGNISTSDIAEVLDHQTRSITEQWLGARGVRQNYSLADLEVDRKNLDRLLGTVKP